VKQYRYNESDRVHQQIDPSAFRIVQIHGAPIEPGFRDDGFPRFQGMDEAWWKDLFVKHPSDFQMLVQLCRSDFPTFCALFLRILSRLTGDIQPFVFNDAQRLTWNRMVRRQQKGEPRFFIILKARQEGLTTFCCAYNFWELWRGTNVRALSIVHDEKLSIKVIATYARFHDNLPDVGGIRPKLRANSPTATVAKNELYYRELKCLGETHIAKNVQARGDTARFINESEAAFYPALGTLNSALMPQLPGIGTAARSKCVFIMESTPNGQNDFYEKWKAAKREGSEFEALFLPWYIQESEYSAQPPPEFKLNAEEIEKQKAWSIIRRGVDGKDVTRAQMYWRRKTIEGEPFNGDLDLFDTEYPSDDESCFLLRSAGAFTDEMRWLQECVDAASVRAKEVWSERVDGKGEQIRTNGPAYGKLLFDGLPGPLESFGVIRLHRPRFKLEASGALLVWEPPVKGDVYFAGSDTAGGEFRRDSSVACIINVTQGRQVAEFASSRFRPEEFADMLVHLLWWYNRAWILPEINSYGSVVVKRMLYDWHYPNVAMQDRWDGGRRVSKPGFFTSPQTRPFIFSALKDFAAEQYVEFASAGLVREMASFKVEGTDYRTDKKNQHDDRVIAAGLACLGIRQSPKMLLEIGQARTQRVPTAIDLGLNHSAVPKKMKGADENLLRKLNPNYGRYPINPLRGYFR
jgi:hypothetical protein